MTGQAVDSDKAGDPGIVAKSASMGITYALADIAAQSFAVVMEGEFLPVVSRIRRTVALTLVGFLAVGPILTLWFEFIERKIPGKTRKAVIR